MSAKTDYSIEPTARELEVLELIRDGKSNLEVASLLCISEKTASLHVYSLFNRYGVNSRVQLVVAALRRGTITLGVA